jgi:acyl carrier protein
MPDQTLHDQIAEFLSERLNVAVFSRTEDLFETGALDSMVFVDLVLYLEQQFDIQISTKELEPDNFRWTLIHSRSPELLDTISSRRCVFDAAGRRVVHAL